MPSWVQRFKSLVVPGCGWVQYLILVHIYKTVFNPFRSCSTSKLVKRAHRPDIYFCKNNSILVKPNVGFDADFESVEKTNATVRQPNALVDFIPPVRDYEFSYGPLRAT
jgi:hypothetical protein